MFILKKRIYGNMKINLVNENYTDNYLTNLLTARGITNITKYLHPDITCLNEPTLLNNIDNGMRLLDNILNKENSNILLVVDCDVDGFTSAAIIWNYIKQLNCPVNLYYKLHQGKQHGLEDLVDEILNDTIHYDLIILPDSSSNDFEYHE